MEASRPPSVTAFFPAALILFLVSALGLYLLGQFVAPTDWRPLWLFFFLLVAGVTGLVLPAVAFLNLRFPTHPPAGASVVLREALWFGLYGAIVAWLQIGRVLTPLLLILLALGFGLIEFLLRLGEKSQWKP